MAAAVTSKPPRPDRFEPNDDAGARAIRVPNRRALKRHATVDFWDDQNDVYAVRLKKGERLNAALYGEKGIDVDLALWNAGTRRLDDIRSLSGQLRSSANPGWIEKMAYRAQRAGRYFVQVKISDPGAGIYTLHLVRK